MIGSRTTNALHEFSFERLLRRLRIDQARTIRVAARAGFVSRLVPACGARVQRAQERGFGVGALFSEQLVGFGALFVEVFAARGRRAFLSRHARLGWLFAHETRMKTAFALVALKAAFWFNLETNTAQMKRLLA